jgi:hypothetical protein
MNMTTQEALKTLGLDESATLKEMLLSWRKLSRLNHPDQFSGDSAAYRAAEDRQKALNVARDTLRKWFADGCPKPRSTSTSPRQTYTYPEWVWEKDFKEESFDEWLRANNPEQAALYDALDEYHALPFFKRFVADAWPLPVAVAVMVVTMMLKTYGYEEPAKFGALAALGVLVFFVRHWNRRGDRIGAAAMEKLNSRRAQGTARELLRARLSATRRR